MRINMFNAVWQKNNNLHAIALTKNWLFTLSELTDMEFF